MKFVIKRNGSQVPFDQNRIKNAIFAAAKSVGGSDGQTAETLTELVVKTLRSVEMNRIPDVEYIQDTVEKVLIESGHAKTAKAYILYRAKHTESREKKRAKIIRQIGRHEAEMKLENGQTEKFSVSRLIDGISHYTDDLPHVSVYQLAKEAVGNLYNGITPKELERAVINASRTKIEQHEDYEYLASRLLLKPLYKTLLDIAPENTKEEFLSAYRDYFERYLKTGIEFGLINPKLAEFDMGKITDGLKPLNDRLFLYRGIKTLTDRYLLRTADRENRIFELPQFLWLRVSMGIALSEKEGVREEKAIEFYHMLSDMLYVPSTPTLFNAGTTHPQLSSCFLNTAPDSLEGIFKTYSDNAMLSKYAGGLGTDWTNVRSTGSRIKGTNGNSQGIIPFLKIFNDIAIAVNQGGKRKGAMCAYLEMWHGDVEEFIESRKNTGDDRRRLHDVHTALWIPDLFMKRVMAKEHWTLFSPSEAPDLHGLYGRAFEKKYIAYEAMNLPGAKKMNAFDLWKRTLTMTYETGHPWITFKDACNIRSPQDHVGVIHNSNLCTEITLNNSDTETAVCNLGSLNLSKFIRHKSIDVQTLRKTIHTAMRMLDNVIDENYYQTPESKNANTRHRPVGLGIMGYQDALYKMDILFDSEKHLDFADEIMERVSYYAIESSSALAGEKGTYGSYGGSKWERGIFPFDTLRLLEKERGVPLNTDKQMKLDWDGLKRTVKKQGMRNSNCMAIAPTATISNIVGVQPCIEPIFRNIYVKENTDGSFVVINHYLAEELRNINLWNQSMINKIKVADGSIQQISEIPADIKRKYKTIFEIDAKWLLKAAARRGKWIDQSQSINIFLQTASGKILNDIYVTAWSLGLKTTYYLRTLSASQVTKTVMTKEPETMPNAGRPVAKQTVNAPSACSIIDPDCEACQ